MIVRPWDRLAPGFAAHPYLIRRTKRSPGPKVGVELIDSHGTKNNH